MIDYQTIQGHYCVTLCDKKFSKYEWSMLDAITSQKWQIWPKRDFLINQIKHSPIGRWAQTTDYKTAIECIS